MNDESFMHAARESDNCIVPAKAPNKDSRESAEGLEGRRLVKGNTGESNPSRTGDGTIGSRGLQGVRETAKKDKGARFTALLHHVNESLLKDSFYSLKRQAAPGVDHVTWQEYAVTHASVNKDWRSESKISMDEFTLACVTASGRLPRTALAKSLHTQARWATAPVGYCRAGGQDRSTGSGNSPQSDL